MLNLQRTLKANTFSSPEELGEHYKLIVRRHQTYPNLCLFKYGKDKPDFSKKLVCESRGIILDTNNDYSVISYPYRKFFAAHESHADKLDWNDISVFDKADGSLCSLYFWDNQWHVSTSGTPDAMGEVHDYKQKTFKELFWETWNKLGYKLPDEYDETKTFVFELYTPYNAVVVEYSESFIKLHGVRSTLMWPYPEIDHEFYAEKYNWDQVKRYELGTLQEISQFVESRSGKEAEGVIVRGNKLIDGSFPRIKLKSLDYLTRARILSGLSVDRNLLDLVVAGKADKDGYLYSQELKDKAGLYKQAVDKLKEDLEHIWNSTKDIPDRKDFAMAVKHLPLSGVLFSLKTGKINSIQEGLENMASQRLLDIIWESYM